MAAYRRTISALLIGIVFAGFDLLVPTTHGQQIDPAVQAQPQRKTYLPLLIGGGRSPDVLLTEPTLTGSWSREVDSRARSGSVLRSSERGASLTFQTTSDQLVLARVVGPSAGQAEVTIDGVLYGTLEFSTTLARWQVPTTLELPGTGAHSVTLTVRIGTVTIEPQPLAQRYDPSPFQSRALTQVNRYRAMVGLPPSQGNAAIHAAAQSHAAFNVRHRDDPRLKGLGAHSEHPDLEGYTGSGSWDRARYFGYSGLVGEVVGGGSTPEDSVDGWMTTVYHRLHLICYDCTEMGFGMVEDPRGNVAVLNSGSRRASYPTSRQIALFPVNGQTDVPHRWGGGEIPDPLPQTDAPVGYPISIQLFQPEGPKTDGSAWRLETAELRDAAGQLVPTYLLDKDHAYSDRKLGPDLVFLVPQQPLALQTTYSVHVAGVDSRGIAFDQRWSFTTEPATIISNVVASPGACGVQISWTTVSTATTWVEFGIGRADSRRVDDQKPWDSGRRHWVQLVGLRPQTSYRYRVYAQDAGGQRRSSAELSLETRAPLQLTAQPGEPALRDVLAQAGACDTVNVAAGSYVLTDTLTVPISVTLSGAGADATTLRGAGVKSVLDVQDGALVEGFTITGSGTGGWNAGVWIGEWANGGKSPTIRNNRISGNTVGIAVYCAGTCSSAPLLSNNTIVDNRGNGIAVSCGTACTSTPQLKDNSITNNQGHGIAMARIPALVQNNRISGNTTGIDLFCDTSCRAAPLLSNNIIVDNRGSGISVWRGSARIINTTLVNNQHGIALNTTAPVSLRNTIIAGSRERGIINYDRSAQLTLAYNAVWGNAKPHYQASDGPGTITADPRFVDPSHGDYRLGPGSPCINAGDPDASANDRDGSRNDIGATGGPNSQ